jgi:flagellar biogenesis protein FliO
MQETFYLLASASPALELNYSPYTLQILRILGFLGILAVGAFLFTRFYKGKKILSSIGKSRGKILISETHSLGNRQFLLVAEYENEKHLLGVSPGSIQHLTSLNKAADVAESFSST